MKNIIYSITFLLFTILSLGQKSNNDVYKMNQENSINVNTTGYIYQHNYDKDVELRVKSKKIINNEIEVVFEYVEIPRGCYRGDLKSYYNRNNNYSTVENVNPYIGSYGTKSADTNVTTTTYSSYTTPIYNGSRGLTY